ncbi:MAG: hypothetical protein ACI88C_003386 [Acidimicrobiales bacterium]|jgi:hypothetical protein
MERASTTIDHRSLRSQKPYFRAKPCRLSTPWRGVRLRLCSSVLFRSLSELYFAERVWPLIRKHRHYSAVS